MLSGAPRRSEVKSWPRTECRPVERAGVAGAERRYVLAVLVQEERGHRPMHSASCVRAALASVEQHLPQDALGRARATARWCSARSSPLVTRSHRAAGASCWGAGAMTSGLAAASLSCASWYTRASSGDVHQVLVPEAGHVERRQRCGSPVLRTRKARRSTWISATFSLRGAMVLECQMDHTRTR